MWDWDQGLKSDSPDRTVCPPVRFGDVNLKAFQVHDQLETAPLLYSENKNKVRAHCEVMSKIIKD